MRWIIVVACTLLPVSSFAAKSMNANKLFGNKPLVFAGVGGGGQEAPDPKDQVTPGGMAYFITGADYNLISFLFLSLHGRAEIESGKMNYDYTQPNATNFQLADAKYSMDGGHVSLGLKFALVNTEHFRFYVGGGGSIGNFSIRLNSESEAAVLLLNANNETSQKTVSTVGHYLDAGIDIIASKVGVRIGGYMSDMESAEVKILGNKKLHLVDSSGYVAILHQF